MSHHAIRPSEIRECFLFRNGSWVANQARIFVDTPQQICRMSAVQDPTSFSPMPSTKKLSALTVRRLRKICQFILAEPQLYCQGSTEKPSVGKAGKCGTPGCLLGWAEVLFPAVKIPAPKRPLNYTEPGWCDFSDHVSNAYYSSKKSRLFRSAMAKLRLTPEQAYRLWEPNAWPQTFRYRWMATFSKTEEASVANERVEHFIKTDGAE